MSTEYDLRCLSHTDDAGYVDRWPEGGIYRYNVPSLFRIRDNLTEIVCLADAIPEMSFVVLGAYGDPDLVDFCRKHEHCRLRIYDEYGREMTSCD